VKASRTQCSTVAPSVIHYGDARAAFRYVIQEIIKDMARNRSVEAKRKVKVLVLHEVDSLTKDAQHSLRRTMEKYSNSCRLVMMCSTISKVRFTRAAGGREAALAALTALQP
jgi:DNA polymerase III delta prime subunit